MGIDMRAVALFSVETTPFAHFLGRGKREYGVMGEGPLKRRAITLHLCRPGFASFYMHARPLWKAPMRPSITWALPQPRTLGPGTRLDRAPCPYPLRTDPLCS